VDLDEILFEGDNIKDDLDFVLFNPVASTVSKWRTFKLVRWAQVLNRLVDLDEIFMGVMAMNVTSATYCLIT
jgi:hypothetical protein